MKTYVHLRQYLAEFFLEWEMFQREHRRTHFKFNTHPPTIPENRAAYETMWKENRMHCCFPTATMVTRTRHKDLSTSSPTYLGAKRERSRYARTGWNMN